MRAKYQLGCTRICNELTDQKITTKQFAAKLKTVATEVCGIRTIVTGKSKKWWDEEYRSQKDERIKQYQTWLKTNDPIHFSHYCDLRMRCKHLRTQKKKETRVKHYKSLNWSFENSTDKFWQLCKKKSSTKIHALKGEDGIATNAKKMTEVMRKHYAKLGQPSQDNFFDDDFLAAAKMENAQHENSAEETKDINLNPPSREEIKQVVGSLTMGKAPGANGVTNEMLKFGGTPIIESLKCIFDTYWRREDIDDKTGIVVSLYKKGDRSDPSNYRGITLLDCVRKVFTKILTNRIQEKLELELFFDEGQAGFRPGRSCADHVSTLADVMINRRKRQLWSYIFFLDLKKAFDTVSRPLLMKSLWSSGIRGKYWRLVNNIYKEAPAEQE